jgi:Ca-activated chloride channel family protein
MPASVEARSAYSRIPLREPAVNYTALTIRPDLTVQRRSPVQLALVIDISGSMAMPIQMEFDLEGANLRDVTRAVLAAGASRRRKIDLVKAAAAWVIGELQEGDVCCVIGFSSKAVVLVPAQVIGGDRSALLGALAQMRAHGGTRMAEGIKAAHAQLGRLKDEQAVRKIVVLTDGQTRDERRCLELAERSSIPYLLGGIGRHYNGRLLEEMARRSQGSAEYIDRAEAVQEFFSGAVTAARATVLTGAVLEIHFRARFRPRRIHQVLPEIVAYDFTPVTATNRRTQVALGDIREEGMTLLVEYLYEGGAAIATEFQVAGLTLGFDQPPLSGLQVPSDDWTIHLVDTSGLPARDPDIARLIDRAAVETARRDLLAAAQGGDAAAARRQLDLLQRRLVGVAADPGFIEQTVETMRLQLDAATALESLADSAAAKRLSSGTRKLALPGS